MLDKPIVTESSNSNAPIVLTVPRSGVTPPALRSHSPQPRVGQAARGREGRGKWLVRLEAVDELPGGGGDLQHAQSQSPPRVRLRPPTRGRFPGIASTHHA
jgi:hypothetical protein